MALVNACSSSFSYAAHARGDVADSFPRVTCPFLQKCTTANPASVYHWYQNKWFEFVLYEAGTEKHQFSCRIVGTAFANCPRFNKIFMPQLSSCASAYVSSLLHMSTFCDPLWKKPTCDQMSLTFCRTGTSMVNSTLIYQKLYMLHTSEIICSTRSSFAVLSVLLGILMKATNRR